MTLKLEIGKTYRNGFGDKIRIDSYDAAGPFFNASDQSSYSPDGKAYEDRRQSGFDLVAECVPADQSQAWAEYRANGGKLDFTAWQEQQPKPEALPLCESVTAEITAEVSKLTNGEFGAGAGWEFGVALGIIRNHFAALTVEELKRAIGDEMNYGTDPQTIEWAAQAVLRLMRRGAA